jgi:hypothetical protein
MLGLAEGDEILRQADEHGLPGRRQTQIVLQEPDLIRGKRRGSAPPPGENVHHIDTLVWQLGKIGGSQIASPGLKQALFGCLDPEPLRELSLLETEALTLLGKSFSGSKVALGNRSVPHWLLPTYTSDGLSALAATDLAWG